MMEASLRHKLLRRVQVPFGGALNPVFIFGRGYFSPGISLEVDTPTLYQAENAQNDNVY